MNDLVAVLTATTLACGLIGVAVRYALLPWLREHIVTPVRETNRQVTVNRHVSTHPTLLDKLDTVSQEVRAVSDKADDLGEQLRAAGRMFDGHIDRSAGEWGRLWDAIDDLQQHNHTHRPRQGDPE